MSAVIPPPFCYFVRILLSNLVSIIVDLFVLYHRSCSSPNIFDLQVDFEYRSPTFSDQTYPNLVCAVLSLRLTP